MSVSRPAWSALRALLEREGFHPSKSLGQNFLLDANMARAIARDADLKDGDHVLEVGPGCCSLSLELVALGVDLLCVEIDRRLASIARGLLEPHAHWRLLETDVLEGKSRLAAPVAAALEEWGGQSWHLAANLPYGLSGPLLVVLARRAVPPRTITVLVQREIADRIVSPPGRPAYGPLGLKLAPLYTARRVRTVPRGVFWPRPRVESCVLRMERRPGEPCDLHAFDTLVDGLFQRRRKTLRKALGAHLEDSALALKALERAQLDPRARAETLSFEALRRLENALSRA